MFSQVHTSRTREPQFGRRVGAALWFSLALLPFPSNAQSWGIGPYGGGGLGAPIQPSQALPGAASPTSSGQQGWRFTPYASVWEGYTTNVSTPTGQARQSYFTTNLGAGLGVSGGGARFRLNGFVAANAYLNYAGSGNATPQNRLYPTANLTGTLEAIEKLFYIDASAAVAQTYYSPFGPQPTQVAVATNNRYTSQVYRVSPYVQGMLGSRITYLIRDDNIWSIPTQPTGSANLSFGNFYANNLTARIGRAPEPLGWTAEYTRNYLSYQNQSGTYLTELALLIVPYQFTPTFQLSARGGYDRQQFPLTESEGAVYGAGLEWRPTERTSLGGYWQERFFGSNYQFTFTHRRPLSSISVAAYRGLNTYPRGAFSIPAGVNVTQALDAAFQTRIPNPAERAQAVDQFLAQTGLPPVLSSPLNFYNQQVLTQQGVNATLALLGARNVLAWTIFRVDSQAITAEGSPLPPALQGGSDNTQTGTGLTFSHRLTGLTSLNATANWARTTSNLQSSLSSTNTSFQVALNTSLSPKTIASAGVYYYIFDPSIGANTSTLTIFGSLNHTF